jgi:hypothetical protein
MSVVQILVKIIILHIIICSFMFYQTWSNLDQERIEGTQELIVKETDTPLNHSNTNYIITVLTLCVCVCVRARVRVIFTKACTLWHHNQYMLL